MFVFQRSEKRVIIQPVRLALPECLKFRSKTRVIRLAKALESLPQQLRFQFMSIPVVDWSNRRLLKLRLVQQSVFSQPFRTDQQRVTGECGIRGIRRVAVAGRSQRQHLPETLTGLDEEIDELVSLRSEVADTKTARQ